MTTRVAEQPKPTVSEQPKFTLTLMSDDLAFAMVSRVRKAMRKAKISETEVAAFTKDAMSGDQRHLIECCLRVAK